MTKTTKIETLLMTKTAKKTYPGTLCEMHTYKAHIREYPLGVGKFVQVCIRGNCDPSGWGLYASFYIMKRLGVFLLPPGWDASPLQGYPQHLNPFAIVPSYIPGWREAL